MPEHTPHSPQLESPAERILPVSSALRTHRSLLEQKSRGGYCWEGWGEEAGPEDSEGEDRNRLWFASAWTQRGLCLDGDGGISPLVESLRSLSMGSKKGKSFGSPALSCGPSTTNNGTLFLAVSLVHAVFFPTA